MTILNAIKYWWAYHRADVFVLTHNRKNLDEMIENLEKIRDTDGQHVSKCIAGNANVVIINQMTPTGEFYENGGKGLTKLGVKSIVKELIKQKIEREK